MSVFFSSDSLSMSRYYRRMLISYVVYKNLSHSYFFRQKKFVYPKIRLTLLDVGDHSGVSPNFSPLSAAFFKQIFNQNYTYKKFIFEGRDCWATTSISTSKLRGFPLFFFSCLPFSSSRRFKYLGFDYAYGFRFSIFDIFGFFGSEFFNKFRLDFFDFRAYLVVDTYAGFLSTKNFKPYFSIFKINIP